MALRKSPARRGSPLYMTPAFELLPKSYDVVRANLRIFGLLYILPLIVGLSNGFWAVDTQRHLGPDTLDATNAVANSALPAYSYGRFGSIFLIALAVAVALRIMLHAAELRAVEEKSLKLKTLFGIVRRRWQQFFGLYVAVSIVTFIWLLPALVYRHMWFEAICFIPVAIMLRRYLVAPYVMLEHPELSVWAVMERSAALTKKDSWSVYLILGTMVLLALFGIVPYIGWMFAFALLFFYSCAPVIRYKELKRLS